MNKLNIEEKDELSRVVLRMNPDIVSWYKQKAKSYGVPYTSYITVILGNLYEQEREKELMREFNSTMMDIKNMSDGSMSSEEMVREMQKIIKLSSTTE